MKPRVVHVITRLIAGGAQKNTVLSCAGLLDRYEVSLVTGPPGTREGSLLGEARGRGIPTEIVPELVRAVRPASEVIALCRLVRIFRRLRPDVVHTHSSKAGILGRAAAWLAGVPIVVHTNHGLPFHPRQSRVTRSAWWLLERLATLVTHKVVCVGEVMRRESIAAGLGPPPLFEVVYSGIEMDRFSAARPVRERLGIPPDVPVAGIISRMASHKGHRFLVEACPPGVHLLLVGDGEERGALERSVAARGVRATFTGHVAPEEIPDLIASTDVVVHPSLWEGLPRAAVEALLVGRPVVAFDCDGAREVVIDGVTGRLVPPGDVAALGNGVKDVLARSDRGRSLGEKGRLLLGQRFEWRAAAADLDRIYQRLLERTRGCVIK